MKKRDDLFILQIQQRIRAIRSHLKGISEKTFLNSDLHKSAVIRELEVIGEVVRAISDETKKKFPQIPWRQITGMRNRLIHEYFSVDESIVAEVAFRQLPELEQSFEDIFVSIAPSVHPWRTCPSGYHSVRQHHKNAGQTTVRSHCRKNPTGKDQLYPDEILEISGRIGPLAQSFGTVSSMTEPQNANNFDPQIVLWTKYWNDIFEPESKLEPEIIKALFFSESSFRLDVKPQKIGPKNFARGPLQISDQTRKILSDEKGELNNHYLTLSAADVKNPDIALAAAIRWLFHKRDLASKRLKRPANWSEAVAEYKGYLSKKDYLKSRGMKNFLETLAILKGPKSK